MFCVNDKLKAKRKNHIMHTVLMHIVDLVEVGAMTAVFGYVWFNYYLKLVYFPFFRIGNYMIIALYFGLFALFCHLYSGFKISISSISGLIYSQAVSILVTNAVMYVVFILLVRTIPTPVPLLVMCLVQFGVGVIWVLEVYRLYFVVNKPKKTVLVCDMRHDIEELMERYELDNRYKVIKSVEINEALNDIEECLGEAENVFLCGIHSHDRNVIIKYCVEKDVSVFVIPRVGDVLMSGAENMHLLHLPVMKLGRYSPIPEYIIVKRAFDIFVSLLGIIVTSPVLIITAIAIKASDGGSAFYKQVRLTKDGKEFKILKFRSMKMDAEKYSGAVLSSGEDDPRLTKVGKFIRKVRIDELPQLFNILKGEMSVVGPRPERPEIAALYEKELPEFSLRLQVKAGLTGYAQVYGKYNTTPYDKLLMDLMYIAKPSIIQDLMIMLATVKILFEKESTEGIEGGDISSNPK